MGKPVVLDTDDVEVLLNAAAATAKIETTLAAVHNDPAMIRLQAKGKIQESLDRVNRERAKAIRPPEDELRPPPGWTPNVEQRQCIERLAAAGPNGLIATDMREYQALRSYGLVLAGQVNEHVRWGDKTETNQAKGELRFRLTALGLDLYYALLRADAWGQA